MNQFKDEMKRLFMEQVAKPLLPNGPIPVQILKEIFAFFKEEALTHGTMALAQMFWSNQDQRYYTHIPKQRTTTSSIKYERDVKRESEDALVLEIHSKARMNAYFSGVDDHDENLIGVIYGVIGCLDKEVPDISLRVFEPFESAAENKIKPNWRFLKSDQVFDRPVGANDVPAIRTSYS